MKLRSGKTLYTYLPDTITNPIKLELKKNIDSLKLLLEDDQPFLEKIVELSLDKGVYSAEIESLIKAKYNNLTPGGHDVSVLYTAFDIGRLIRGNHQCIRQELSKLPIEAEDLARWKMVQKTLRTEIEKEVISSIFSESIMQESSINAVGESEQSFDEM